MSTTNKLFKPFAVFFILCISLVACRSTKDNEPSLPKDLAESIPFDFQTLQKVPDYKWINQTKTDSAWSLTYEGELFNDKPTEVFAYYASPATLDKNRSADEQYPGIVLIHGGGGTAFRVWVLEWAKRGYSAIAMDLGGSSPEAKQEFPWATKSYRLDRGGPPQNDHHKFYQINEDFNQQWQFHAISNIIRAHSLLISFPETDDKLTAVTGISWGGYLTSIVSGIDHRFDFSVRV